MLQFSELPQLLQPRINFDVRLNRLTHKENPSLDLNFSPNVTDPLMPHFGNNNARAISIISKLLY